MPAPGRYDIQKDKRWREIFLRWQQSGLSKAAFCRREGLGLSTFCDWRRRIQLRDQDNAKREKINSKREDLSRPSSDHSPAAALEFAPVVLRENIRPEPRSTDHVLSLQLTSGISLLVQEHCSTKFLAQVIRSLEENCV